MTTLDPPVVLGRLRMPTRSELRAMLTDRAVAITMIVCATVFAVVAVSAAAYLATHGAESAVIGALITGPLAWLASVIIGRVQSTRDPGGRLPPQG